jgi:hypothetical protein
MGGLRSWSSKEGVITRRTGAWRQKASAPLVTGILVLSDPTLGCRTWTGSPVRPAGCQRGVRANEARRRTRSSKPVPAIAGGISFSTLHAPGIRCPPEGSPDAAEESALGAIGLKRKSRSPLAKGQGASSQWKAGDILCIKNVCSLIVPQEEASHGQSSGAFRHLR